MLFTACDPLEDEVKMAEDASAAERPAIAVDLTLASDDYEFFGGDIESNGGFATVEEARTSIPNLLANKYPQAGANSVSNTTFDVVKFDGSAFEANSYVTVARELEVSAQDYADLGFTFGNFSNDADIDVFMKFKYPNGVITDDAGNTLATIQNAAAVQLKYKYWTGTVEDRENIVYYMDGTWHLPGYILEDADYDYMGNGRFNNFNTPEEAVQEIPVWMAERLYQFDKTPVEMIAMEYKQWTGSFVALRLNFYSFDGTSGSLFNGRLTYTEPFGYNTTKKVWEGDNTIKYTLTGEDYTAIGNKAVADGNANSNTDLVDAGENLLRFGNFNLFDWTEDMMINGISARLLTNFPSAEEGQKYLITYDFYNGSSGTTTIKLILEGGAYVKFTE
jgi:hypothetical protein